MGGLLAFRVGNYDNTAEREQFRFLCEQLKAHYKNSNEFCVLVGNYNIGCELDALFIKRDAIIAIEFKNYGGHIIANENGEWTCDGTTIKGGSRKTVLQQARINHSIVKKELKVLGVESKQIKDVPTLVVFHQPIELTNNISNTNKSWLHIADDNHFIEKLDDITCPHTNLSPLKIVELAELLNLNSFYLSEFSNAVYDKPIAKIEQLKFFEDVKSSEIQEEILDCNLNQDYTNSIECPPPSIENKIDDENTKSHGSAVLTELKTPTELVQLCNYAKQIVDAVCGNKSSTVNVLKHNDFIMLYPAIANNVKQETIILVDGEYTKEEISHLSRFLCKSITTITPYLFFWQTGDYLLQSVILDENIDTVSTVQKNEIEEKKESMKFPRWLDDYIFNKLKAKYAPDYIRFEYNLNLNREEALTYLGTYFPRSYIESSILFAEFTVASNFASIIKSKKELKILDLGCGTGGEIFGVLSYIENYLPFIERVKLLAIDGNQESLRLFEDVMVKFRLHTNLYVEYNIGPVFIENIEDLNLVSEIVSDKYDFVLSCKAICEMLSKNIIGKKSYKQTALMLSSKLSDDGLLFIEDVTIKSPATNNFIPYTLNSELNEFTRENKGFETLFPIPCFENADKCKDGCFFKREFVISHSHKQNDISKVVYRFIGRNSFCKKLKFSVKQQTVICKLN
jgi:SAM-dependent methyltransferase